MTKRVSFLTVIMAIAMLMPLWSGGGKAEGATVNLLPYFFAGKVGDYWTYTFISPAGQTDFTAYLTQVTSGPLAGKLRYGDYVDIIDAPHLQYRIGDGDASSINIYETEMGSFNPPLRIDTMQALDTVIPTPFAENDYWYFQKLTSAFTVPAGTFYDVLVHIDLDTVFGPTSANAVFGLDPSIPYGVTHVGWYAPGIGWIQDRDYDQFGNMLFEYQLKATSVPVPAPLALVGTGLLGLLGWRRWFAG
jgi:hypothetical protein